MILQLIVGLALSALIGLVGYWRGSLTRSGVLGAILTGTAIFAFGGLSAGILLVAFFISSSVLSHYHARAKVELADKFQKGSRRDLGQALANGGCAALLALAYGLTLKRGLTPANLAQANIFFSALVGALATVTADTWATEIGVLSKQPPRLITTGRVVPIGTSGGITLLGTLTALAGALFIGVMSLIVPLGLGQTWSEWLAFLDPGRVGLAWKDYGFLVVIACISGLGGALFDSLLGATVQAIYYCEYDQKETERRVHSCGRPTRLIRGYVWLDNDMVNFLASAMGSLIAALLVLFV